MISFITIHQFLKNHKKDLIIIGCLIFFAAVLRFFHLSQWFFFNVDEDWYSYLVRKIAVEHRLVLVGWEIPGGIIVPPVMIYFGAIISFIFQHNPLGLAIVAALFGVCTVALIYIVGKKLFDAEIALYAAILYCFSYFVVIYNRLSINLLFGPLLSILSYLALFEISKGRHAYVFVLALIWIFAFQEGSMLSLVVLSLVFTVSAAKKLRLREVLIAFAIFLMSFSTLLIFDVRHNFLVLKKFWGFFAKSSPSTFALGHFWNAVDSLLRSFTRMFLINGQNDINKQILPCTSYQQELLNTTSWAYIAFAGIFLLLFIYLALRRKQFGYRVIFVHLGIVLVGLFIYSVIKPGYLHEWFFNMLTPAYAFIIGSGLAFLRRNAWGKTLLVGIFAVFIITNLYLIATGTAVVGYRDKLSVVVYATQMVGDEPFSLDILGNGCNGQGYRYLFTYVGKEPTQSYMDGRYNNWIYDAKVNAQSTRKVTIIPHSDLESIGQTSAYQQLVETAIAQKTFGTVSVVISK